MCIKAGLHILPCLLLLNGQSTFLEVPAMHRKEPASRDVLPARTSLYHVVMQRSHPHGKTWRRDPANALFARSFMQQAGLKVGGFFFKEVELPKAGGLGAANGDQGLRPGGGPGGEAP